ncbi:TPA: hypothetical protein DDW69_01610 [candidate division CPR2 bacterium]|uniref:Uncharacterized protein n=1 Tax=candidate division CPR2 bacterium GW2011_GWC1_41_48 TaxID=1618344 RepID=A0A0G0W9T7_UNCC2|nr:MAG: hypothetical protein UT47_C0001G0125 [candidate division CPR2 bacterium GW2011_GWC2_39_35]KKR28582.1 MAG: hypothetical protein UT60_C0017G0011 [candidate division CPR2 bacterium GW2011_GWD2_39_7]KKR29620.1 MAG: hypothetical protein UT59_C0003G0011 [candidate division CPR2 bacterium GW2011_GWD1_39_7]KKS09720.1 MAG: hypothetical protein UU65_C0001G0125 [candidate division CPR2 bacterium GW2011_GWC1_41_48]OGB56506.1 MAG: hypothetical protein A2Y27_01225 [candidate division CPR2 bacterium G
MNTFKNINNQGATLIELAIYMGLVGFIMVALVGITVPLLKSSEKNKTETELHQNARFVLEKLSQNINQADPATVSVSLPGDELFLTVKDPETDAPTPVKFSVDPSTNIISFEKPQGNPSPEKLTSAPIKLLKRGGSTPFFQTTDNTANGSTLKTVMINFEIRYYKGSNLITSEEYQTTYALKRI